MPEVTLKIRTVTVPKAPPHKTRGYIARIQKQRPYKKAQLLRYGELSFGMRRCIDSPDDIVPGESYLWPTLNEAWRPTANWARKAVWRKRRGESKKSKRRRHKADVRRTKAGPPIYTEVKFDA